MCINEASLKLKKYNIKQKGELINDVKFKNYINSRNKKIQEEIKDIIIDKYREKIIAQQKEIEQLKKNLDNTIKSSLLLLKNAINTKNNSNNLSLKIQKQKLKNDILNIKDNNDIIVHILNRNNKTVSSDKSKLKKNITQLNKLAELPSEHKKNSMHEINNLSLSNSRIKLNKYEIITPQREKIEKIDKPKTKSKSKNKKEKESARQSTIHAINNININDLNTYYLKEYNKKDFQKIEEIKTKLLNNKFPPSDFIKDTSPKIKNSNKKNIFKSYSQNKYKKVKKQNIVNKENNYSYGQNNLKNIFNSPKNIKTHFFNENNNYLNNFYINKNKFLKNTFREIKNVMENGYLLTNPTYITKDIIHKNMTNNNNSKIYINTDYIDNGFLKNINKIKGINKYYETQSNFYHHTIINRGNSQLSLNCNDYMKTTPT